MPKQGRAAVETFINASYLLAESDDVAARAIEHASYATWRHYNRRIGNGDFTLDLHADPDPQGTLEREYSEFSGKGAGSWTKLDVPSRIQRVGKLVGRRPGARLLAAYGLIYSLSSEIIHGSPYGANYFYFGHADGGSTVEEFRAWTARQLENVLIAALHAASGYLAAFFEKQNMQTPMAAEEEVFQRLLALSTGP